MATGVQIAGVLFGAFMLYYTFLNYKRKQFTTTEFTFWIVVWGSFGAIAIYPSILDLIAPKIGAYRNLDLITLAGLMFLSVSVFYTYTLARKNQKQLETVVREIAIKRRK